MKILYFAWIRVRIGLAEEDIALPQKVTDVAGLIEHLRTRTAGHAIAFNDLSVVRVAVNQEYVGFGQLVCSTDEVAFFPPVTGG